MKQVISLCAMLLLCLAMGRELQAATLMVAVASNFSRPLERISALFTERTGIDVGMTAASTGKLYSMIKHGAPFDLFLSADTIRPEMLREEGVCEAPFVYASGIPVLWASESKLCDLKSWQEALRSPELTQIAIANPETAPYGAAVTKAMSGLPLKQDSQERLVYTLNVGQSFQYAEKITGAGFTSLSYALSKIGRSGCYWPVSEAERVTQKGCVLMGKRHEEEVELFVAFLNGSAAKRVLAEYGYILE